MKKVNPVTRKMKLLDMQTHNVLQQGFYHLQMKPPYKIGNEPLLHVIFNDVLLYIYLQFA